MRNARLLIAVLFMAIITLMAPTSDSALQTAPVEALKFENPPVAMILAGQRLEAGVVSKEDYTRLQKDDRIDPELVWDEDSVLVKSADSGELVADTQLLRRALFIYKQRSEAIDLNSTRLQTDLEDVQLTRLTNFLQENIAALRDLLTGFVLATAKTQEPISGAATAAASFLIKTSVDGVIQGEDWLRKQIGLYWSKIEDALSTLRDMRELYLKDASHTVTLDEAYKILAAQAWYEIVFPALPPLDDALHDYSVANYLKGLTISIGISQAGQKLDIDEVQQAITKAITQKGGNLFSVLSPEESLEVRENLAEVQAVIGLYDYFSVYHENTIARFPELKRFSDNVGARAKIFSQNQENRLARLSRFQLQLVKSAQTADASATDVANQVLAFLYTIAHQAGSWVTSGIESLINRTISDDLVDPIGFLILLTLYLILANVAKRIAFIVVVVSWIFIIIRVVLEVVRV